MAEGGGCHLYFKRAQTGKLFSSLSGCFNRCRVRLADVQTEGQKEGSGSGCGESDCCQQECLRVSPAAADLPGFSPQYKHLWAVQRIGSQ